MATAEFGGTPGTLRLDRASLLPIATQLEAGLRGAIISGQLAPGARVPSTRVLARVLGVARNTVTVAYEELEAQGYLQARVGSGTVVVRAIPDSLIRAPLRPRGIEGPPQAKVMELSERGRSLAALRVAHALEGGTPAPFRPGIPALDLFPSDLWARLATRVWRSMTPAERLGHGEPAGLDKLRIAIAEHLGATRAVRCRPEQVVIVPGSQFALTLVAHAFADPGDEVWVEDPCRGGVHAALRSGGLKAVPIPLDESGIDVTVGRSLAPNAKLAYVSSSRQYPTGVTTSFHRRVEILDWAASTGSWVIEDDYEGELRYNGKPLPSLQGMRTDGRVIYVGSFSRTIFPSLRLAYLVMPEALVGPLVRVRSVLDRFPTTHAQATVAAFMAEGHFDRHLRRMRRAYCERQDALLDELEDSKILVPQPADAGLHLIARIPFGTSDLHFERLASQVGIEAVALSRHCLGSSPQLGLILGFAAYPANELRAAALRLKRQLERSTTN